MMTDDESLSNDNNPNGNGDTNGVVVKLKKIVRSIVRTLLFMKLDRPVCQITYYRSVEDPEPLVFKGVFANQAEPLPRGMPRKGYGRCLCKGPVNPCILIEVADQADFDSMVVEGTRTYEKLIPLIAYRIFQSIKRRSQGDDGPYVNLKPHDILLTGPLGPQTSTGNVVALSLDQLRFADRLRNERSANCWYRSPESLFGLEYTTASDMWSAGLILAELVTQRRIVAGRRDFEQLELISQYFLRRRASTGEYPRDAASLAVQSMVPTERMPPRCLKREMVGADPLLIDLVFRLLTVDYEKRLTIDKVFQHPFLTNFTETLKPADHQRFHRFWAFPDKHSLEVEEMCK